MRDRTTSSLSHRLLIDLSAPSNGMLYLFGESVPLWPKLDLLPLLRPLSMSWNALACSVRVAILHRSLPRFFSFLNTFFYTRGSRNGSATESPLLERLYIN